jgi:hypothetical protein
MSTISVIYLIKYTLLGTEEIVDFLTESYLWTLYLVIVVRVNGILVVHK